MARVTVEDCLDHVNNRFDLVLTAAERARNIANGAAPRVVEENDKCTVLALREIADGILVSPPNPLEQDAEQPSAPPAAPEGDSENP